MTWTLCGVNRTFVHFDDFHRQDHVLGIVQATVSTTWLKTQFGVFASVDEGQNVQVCLSRQILFNKQKSTGETEFKQKSHCPTHSNCDSEFLWVPQFSPEASFCHCHFRSQISPRFSLRAVRRTEQRCTGPCHRAPHT